MSISDEDETFSKEVIIFPVQSAIVSWELQFVNWLIEINTLLVAGFG